MKIIELITYINNEKRAEEFLRSRGILKTFTRCHNCASDKLGMIRGNKWKCYSCKSEWTRKKNSLLSQFRMKYSEFLLCLKFFELELTAEKTSQQLNLNYKTVNYLFRTIRMLILQSGYYAEINRSQTLSKEDVFVSICRNRGKLYFDLTSRYDNAIAKIKIDRCKIAHSGVIFNASVEILKTMNTKNLIDLPSDLQKFIRFTKEKLFKYRGIDYNYLQLYLKEIEFRFNNLGRDIFELLIVEISKNFKGG
jgi:transposase